MQKHQNIEWSGHTGSFRSPHYISFRPAQSPVSIFQTNLTCLSLCKGRKCSAARIGDDNFRGGSPLVMVLHQDSVSQFSRQPSTASEPRFDFPDQFNTFNHRQRPKTFRSANWRHRFWIAIESPFKASSGLNHENLSNGRTLLIFVSFFWTIALHMLRFVSNIHMCYWGPQELNQDLLCESSVVNILRAEYNFCMKIPPS